MTLSRFADARVMVIDDNGVNVALLDALLKRAGLVHVYLYTDPQVAVAALADVRPDLVLVDLHMPHLDGYGVLNRLATYAAGSYLPALVLTADTSAQAIERALGAGARDFLTKPFDIIEVVLRVQNLLETRFLHQSLRRHNLQLSEQIAGFRRAERSERFTWQLQHDRVARVVRDEDLWMAYQPVYDLASGTIVGVEALARFRAEPNRGPDLWFAEASKVGLTVELELAAIRAAAAVLDGLPEPWFLAVNASPATILSGELAYVCTKEVCPRVIVELTEHVPVEDYDALAAAVEGFREWGLRLAVDDTGAGYAGFRHLLGLRPEIVKLDLMLTSGIDADPARRALASALVRFTKDTDADLIAEGVETAAELETLRELHVPWGQGYHLARPQPLDALISQQVG